MLQSLLMRCGEKADLILFQSQGSLSWVPQHETAWDLHFLEQRGIQLRGTRGLNDMCTLKAYVHMLLWSHMDNHCSFGLSYISFASPCSFDVRAPWAGALTIWSGI